MAEQRLKYIDSLRGLAIFTVVYSHILIFCMSPYPESFIITFLRLFYLNGFFFISGYLFYKPLYTFTNKKVANILIKKTKQVLLPTLIWGIIYWYTHGIDMFIAIFDTAKMGYWFTFVLYEMFILFAFLMWLLCCFKCKKWMETVLFIAILIVGLAVFRLCNLKTNSLALISAFNFFFYLPMFILGILSKKYHEAFHKLLNSKIYVTLLFCVVMANFVIKIPSILVTISIVLLLFCVSFQIEKFRALFYQKGVGKIMLILGNYSMEIYFIHYFLIFKLPTSVSDYFSSLAISNRCLSFPEFIIIGSIAMGICLGAIVIAKMLRRIPYVNSLALGK